MYFYPVALHIRHNSVDKTLNRYLYTVQPSLRSDQISFRQSIFRLLVSIFGIFQRLYGLQIVSLHLFLGTSTPRMIKTTHHLKSPLVFVPIQLRVLLHPERSEIVMVSLI